MMMNHDKPVVELNNVSFRYGQRRVLTDIHLTLKQGEFLGLVGPNGSGKSTLIKIILGLLKPEQGEVRLFGQPIEQFREWWKIGYVSQKANSFNSGFPATVFEVVSMGLYGKMGLFSWMGRREKERVKEAIKQVGLTEYMKQPIGKLSGGQQQRAFIARALVSDPQLLILDEPTVGVDSQSVEQFYHFLQEMHRNEGISILMVTHDVSVMTSHVDRIACLNKKLHFHGPPKEYVENQDRIIQQVYGHDVHVIEHHHH